MKSKNIELPYTFENLLKVLESVSVKNPPYFHAAIANWCFEYVEDNILKDLSFENKLEEKAYNIASNIDNEWEVFLENSYTLEELQDIDIFSICLPLEWFEEWTLELRSYKEKNQ